MAPARLTAPVARPQTMHPTLPPRPAATHHTVGACTALRTLLRLAAAVLCLIAAAGQQAQAQVNALDVTDGFKPSVKFTETLQEVAAPSTPEGLRTLTTSTLTLVANIEGINLASVNASTQVTFALENLNFSRTLGDDPAYLPGKTSAVFALGVNGAGNPDASKASVRASWTSTRLTLVITLGQAAVNAPSVMMATQEYGQPAEPKLYRTALCSLSFAGITGDRPLYVTGSHAIKNTTISGTPVELNTIKLSGMFDVAPPVLTLGRLKSGVIMDESSSRFTIKATDAILLEASETTIDVSIGINPSTMGAWQLAAPGESTEGGWGTNSLQVTLDSLHTDAGLPYGRFYVQVRARDQAGNVALAPLITLYRRLPDQVLGRWEGGDSSNDSSTGEENRGVVSFILDHRGYILSGRLRYVTDSGQRTTHHSISFAGLYMGSEKGLLIPRRGQSPLRLTFSELFAGGSSVESTIRVTLNDSAIDPSAGLPSVISVAAYRTPYSSRNPVPTGVRGRYHIGYNVGSDQSFLGHGFSALAIAPSGSVAITGRTADGEAYTGSAQVGPNGEVALLASMYGGQGYFWQKPHAVAYDTSPLYAEWRRPARPGSVQWPEGIYFGLDGEGSYYTPPGPGMTLFGTPFEQTSMFVEWGYPADVPSTSWPPGSDPYRDSVAFHWTSATQAVPTSPNFTSSRLTRMDPATGIITGTFYIYGFVWWNPIVTFRAQVVGDKALGYYTSKAPNNYTGFLYGSIKIEHYSTW